MTIPCQVPATPKRRRDLHTSPPLAVTTTCMSLIVLGLVLPMAPAFVLPFSSSIVPSANSHQLYSSPLFLPSRTQTTLYATGSELPPQRQKQKKGGREGYNKSRRREDALSGMNVGQRFEMGYDIEDETVPLEQDDALPLIETIANAADMRKGEDVYAIRVSSLTTVSSFFVLVSGNSRPQIQAIAGAIEDDMMEKHGMEARNGGEGTADSGWILLDFGSVVVNVMTPVARKYYALEKLWKKGEEVDLSHILKPNAPPGSENGMEEGREGGREGPSSDPSLIEDAFWS